MCKRRTTLFRFCIFELSVNFLESDVEASLKAQGLVDSLTRYFTPTNKRRSRVAQASLMNNIQLPSETVESEGGHVANENPSTSLTESTLPSSSSSSTMVSSRRRRSNKSRRNFLQEKREKNYQITSLFDGLSHLFSASDEPRRRLAPGMYSAIDGSKRLRTDSQPCSPSSEMISVDPTQPLSVDTSNFRTASSPNIVETTLPLISSPKPSTSQCLVSPSTVAAIKKVIVRGPTSSLMRPKKEKLKSLTIPNEEDEKVDEDVSNKRRSAKKDLMKFKPIPMSSPKRKQSSM